MIALLLSAFFLSSSIYCLCVISAITSIDKTARKIIQDRMYRTYVTWQQQRHTKNEIDDEHEGRVQVHKVGGYPTERVVAWNCKVGQLYRLPVNDYWIRSNTLS